MIRNPGNWFAAEHHARFTLPWTGRVGSEHFASCRGGVNSASPPPGSRSSNARRPPPSRGEVGECCRAECEPIIRIRYHRQKRRAGARLSVFGASRASLEAAGGVGEHGVDLAGLRGQIRARHHRAAVVARDVIEQPLELADVAVDRLLELAVAAIALAD